MLWSPLATHAEPDPKKNFQLQANEAETPPPLKKKKNSTWTNSKHLSYHYQTQPKKNRIRVKAHC